MRISAYQIMIVLLCGFNPCAAQSVDNLNADAQKVRDALYFHSTTNYYPLIVTDTGNFIIIFHRTICKSYTAQAYFIPKGIAESKVKNLGMVPVQKPKFLTVHGNISYDFFYRSKMDTPVNQMDFQQHTERVYMNILIKEKYPLKVSFAARQSNSPFFRNFQDMNLQFDPNTFHRNLKEELIRKLSLKLADPPGLDSVENELRKVLNKYSALKNWLKSSSTLQQIIEERERKYHQQLAVPKESNAMEEALSLEKLNFTRKKYKFEQDRRPLHNSETTIDSSLGTFASRYKKKKNEVDSLSARLHLLEIKKDSLKNVFQNKTITARQKIYQAGSEKELERIALENGIQPDHKSKLEKQLSSIKSFNIGRSTLNYTELTAQNITVTGVNIEYNSSHYAAIAAGKINYRFRDFFNNNNDGGNQYITLGRIGLGNIEKKALILSVFRGRKSQSSHVLPDSIKNDISILGYSVEAIFKKNNNTLVSAEFAKSTKPVVGDFRANKEIGSLWEYDDKTNMGVNIKGQTLLSSTDTKISGFFRKTGENFQSFSMFSYNTDQTAWLARVDQPLFKRRVTVTGMIRQNDFTNPFTEKTYKTSTTFKTIILSAHFPKYPVINLGYYPGTQLYIIDKERIRENAYYILNGSLVYSYYYKGTGMNTSIILNRYFNKATDSGFVMYKGISYYGSHSVFLKKIQLQGSCSYNKQAELRYSTIEGSGDYALKNFLKIGGGIKYNKIREGKKYWGERVQLTIDFKDLGGLQLRYDKSYLPSINQTLYPIESGQVSWYKTF